MIQQDRNTLAAYGGDVVPMDSDPDDMFKHVQDNLDEAGITRPCSIAYRMIANPISPTIFTEPVYNSLKYQKKKMCASEQIAHIFFLTLVFVFQILIEFPR